MSNIVKAELTDFRQMIRDEEIPDLEESPLSGTVNKDGMVVEVHIYRIADTHDRWTLEVVDDEGGSTVWDETFATDQEAYKEFYLTVEKEGISTFLNSASHRLN